MVASFHWPHGDVRPLLTDNPWWLSLMCCVGCGQRASVVDQIHSPFSLPRRQLGVAASSLGRDHAPRRIDSYPAGTARPLTTIDIHVSREPESCGGDQTTTGLQGAIYLPDRLTAAAVSLL